MYGLPWISLAAATIRATESGNPGGADAYLPL
jgi:hypothetical protein